LLIALLLVFQLGVFVVLMMRRIRANNMVVNLFAYFERTLEDLGADDLMRIVRAYLSRGIVACQKGFEKATAEAKTSLDK
jgi:hypothetical protein